jgi:3-hydroxyisobutyrate dehydrogenase-like beta-hydroxyacid dehydrogenase
MMTKENTRRIAVVGTGIMGSGIVHNYLKNGYEVIVWNRTKAHADTLISEGAQWAATPKEAVEKADIIFEVTANDESSRAVWTGSEGIFAAADSAKFLITSATLSAGWTDELAGLCKDKDLQFLDMPMTGGRPAAESGNLVFLAGGNKDVLEEIRPILEPIASKIIHFGEAGSGMKYKLILNMLQGIHMAGFGEAMRLARAAGLDETQVGEALAERPGGVTTAVFGWGGYYDQPKPINFSVEWESKDIDYALELAGDTTKLQVAQAASDAYHKAIEQGEGQGDFSIIASRDFEL